MTAADLMGEFERVSKELEAIRKALKKALKVKRTAKTDPETGEVVKRAPTAWIAWTKHVKDTYSKEYEKFAARQESKKGVLPAFAKHCRETLYAEEWAEFEATHKAAHPPASKAKSTSSKAKAAASVLDTDVDETDTETTSLPVASKVGKAKAAAAALLTDDEDEPIAKKADKKAKKAEKEKKADKKEKKAEKKTAGAAAAAAPLDDEEEELTPFTLGGVVYLQNSQGHSWFRTASGECGKWAGVFDGTVLDTIVENPYEDE